MKKKEITMKERALNLLTAASVIAVPLADKAKDVITSPATVTLPALGLLISCSDDGDKDPQVEKHTINLTGDLAGYSVTIENRSDQDITAIITKLQNAFNGLTLGGDLANFKTVLGRNLVIVVEGGTPYGGAKPVNNRIISFHYNSLNVNNITNIGLDIKDAVIYDLYPMGSKSLSKGYMFDESEVIQDDVYDDEIDDIDDSLAKAKSYDAMKYAMLKSAEMPYFSALLRKYPNTTLSASGESVGLPKGTIGNSEVGHNYAQMPAEDRKTLVTDSAS